MALKSDDITHPNKKKNNLIITTISRAADNC